MAVKDILVNQQLLAILDTEVSRIAEFQREGELNGGRIANLEKLTKMFHTLRCEERESEKSLGKLSEKELLELADESSDSDNTTD